MSDTLDEMHAKVKKGKRIDLSNIEKLIKKHESIEEEVLYLELNRALSDKDKEELMGRPKVF